MKKTVVFLAVIILPVLYSARKQDAAYFTQLGIDKLLYQVEDPETEGMFPVDALKYLEKAISLDSTYALAYAYLPYTYNMHCGLEGKDRQPFIERSRWAVKKALELAPNHSMTLLAAGWVKKDYDNDLEGAIDLMKQAIAADPNNTEAYRELAWAYYGDYKDDLALEQAELALKADPRSRSAKYILGFIHKRLGNYEQAIQAFQENLGENINNLWDRSQLAHTLMQVGKFDQAEEVARQNLKDYPNFNEAKYYACYAFAMNKKYDEALELATEINNRIAVAWIYALMGNKEKTYEEIIELQGSEDADSQWAGIAGLYVGLGEHDKAIEAFEKALVNAKANVTESQLINFGHWLATEPWYQPIKDDPRFQAIVAQTGYTK